jgi:hypothetical protein
VGIVEKMKLSFSQNFVSMIKIIISVANTHLSQQLLPHLNKLYEIFVFHFYCWFLQCSQLPAKTPSDPPPPHQNTFTATINGNAFVSAKIEVSVSGSSVPGAKSVLIQPTDAIGR